ncbi:translation initiation factor IF-2-like [Myotis myotis]|uniref:translation initiation factor IF-2-like n=1 Tax=Myotis myotis TaxID=51298 RepID=UPI00174D0018|nr:translation initiation factor IF-2-like [Myotis myotis]
MSASGRLRRHGPGTSSPWTRAVRCPGRAAGGAARRAGAGAPRPVFVPFAPPPRLPPAARPRGRAGIKGRGRAGGAQAADPRAHPPATPDSGGAFGAYGGRAGAGTLEHGARDPESRVFGFCS